MVAVTCDMEKRRKISVLKLEIIIRVKYGVDKIIVCTTTCFLLLKQVNHVRKVIVLLSGDPKHNAELTP